MERDFMHQLGLVAILLFIGGILTGIFMHLVWGAQKMIENTRPPRTGPHVR